VTTTWRIEMLTKRELSNGMVAFTPFGKYGDSWSSRWRMAVAVASALPVGDSCTPMPVDGRPSSRACVP
jgi:hypothetical protein